MHPQFIHLLLLLLLFVAACAAHTPNTKAATEDIAITDANSSQAMLEGLLKEGARDVPYFAITGEIPNHFTLRVRSLFSNEHPSYPFCTRYTLGGPSPLGLERYVSYKISSLTERFFLAVPLDYAAFEAPLSSLCAPWYHASTSIFVYYLGKPVMPIALGIVRASELEKFSKGQPLISPIDIECSKELLESADAKDSWRACKTTLGPAYGWWFGLTEDFIATISSVQEGISAPHPLTIRIKVTN